MLTLIDSMTAGPALLYPFTVGAALYASSKEVAAADTLGAAVAAFPRAAPVTALPLPGRMLRNSSFPTGVTYGG